MEYANFFGTKLRKSAKLLKNDENGKCSQQQWAKLVKNYPKNLYGFDGSDGLHCIFFTNTERHGKAQNRLTKKARKEGEKGAKNRA